MQRNSPPPAARLNKQFASQNAAHVRMLHGELLSLAGLEEFAAELAGAHTTATGPIRAQPLLPLIERSTQTLAAVYTQLADVARGRSPLMPGDESLLDNYHIVQDTARE